MFCNKYSKRLKMLSLILCIIIVFAQTTPIVYADSDTRESTPIEQTSNVESNSEEKPDSSTESNLDEKTDSSKELNSEEKTDSSTESDTEKPDSSTESNLDEKNDSSTESNSEEKPDSSTEPNSEEKPDLNSESSSDSKSDSSVETNSNIESDQKNETDSSMEPAVSTESAFEKEEVNKEVMTPIELLDLKMIPKWNIYEITYENAGKGDIEWYVDNVENGEFSIQNVSQLQGLSDIVNGKVTKVVTTISITEKIKNDLLKTEQNAEFKVDSTVGENVGENAEITDVSKTTYQFDFSGKTVSLYNDIKLSEHWNPIGTETNPYKGTFDGKGKCIQGLKVSNNPDENPVSYVGFFGCTENAKIHNLLLESVNVQGSDYVGALIGYGENTNIKNIGVSGNVIGNTYVAGIAGNLADSSSVSGCYFYGANDGSVLIANCDSIEHSYVLGVPNEENKKILSEEDFANGKAAYLLDNGSSDSRTHAWTKGTKYPILTDSADQAVYNISVKDGIENGSISVVSYAAAGSDVEVKSSPQEDYILKSLEIKTAAETKNECGKTIFFKMPESDVDLMAEFIQKPEFDNYNVTFITNGGTIEGSQAGEEEHIVQVETGEKVNKPVISKVENGITYSLMGWYEDKTFTKLYDFNSPVMSEIKLYARWIESEAMLVKFDLNNANDIDGVVCPEEQKLLKGELIKKPVDPKWNGEFVDGVEIFQHKFLGWSTKKEKGEIWDFEKNTISFDTKDSDLTLYAQWEDVDYFATGTKEAPCEIKSEIILEKLRDKVNEGNSYKDCYFKQTETLNLAKVTPEGESVSWVPIGTEENPFSGNFDGNGYTISELIIKADVNRAGLFGTVSGGSLNNIKVTGNIQGKNISNTYYVYGDVATGGIVGYISNATKVVDCTMNGKVEGGGAVGGIVGYISVGDQDCIVENCINKAQITSSSDGAGGIVGWSSSSLNSYQELQSRQAVIIKNCVNNGSINVDGDSAGGVIGKVNGAVLEMDSCINNGKATGTGSNVGGLVSNVSSCRKFPSSITNCINTGNISGKGCTAGIVGEVEKYSLIAECQNRGKIQAGDSNVGGILGSAADYVTIRNCVNDAPIILDAQINYVGGIAGALKSHASITGCHNTEKGTLHTEALGDNEELLPGDYVGGIVGQLGKSVEALENCSNKAKIMSKGNYTGGLVGKMDGAWQDGPAMKNIINYGDVSSKSDDSSSYLGGVFGYAGFAYQRLKFIANEGNVTGVGGSIGGLCGYLDKYSQIFYSYNSGDISYTADSVNGVGGLVGENNDSKTSYERYCHSYGKVKSSTEKENVGPLAGTNIDKIKNCYYRSDSETDNGGRTVEQFRNGQVAYELDNGKENIRTYNWAQGSSYPVFKKDANEVYTYKLMPTENGSLTPVSGYVNAGQNVVFEAKANTGYMLSKVRVSGDDGRNSVPFISGTKVYFIMPQANVTVYADFKEKGEINPGATPCTVTFKSNGGSAVDCAAVTCGDTIAKPKAPEKEGYVFKGWYTDKECTLVFDFGTAIVSDMVLYAKWVTNEENQLTVSFNLNGAPGEAPTNQNLVVGSHIEKPSSPVWKTDGETVNSFVGWFTAKNGGSQWNFTEDKVQNDIILYAHWSANDKFLSGTKECPFVFYDEETLKEFAENVNEGNGYGDNYFELGSDITITDSNWPGIGYVKVRDKNGINEITESGTVPFKGHFNGKEKTITLNGDQNSGIFGSIGTGGVVENLNISATLKDSNKRELFGGVANMNFGEVLKCNANIDAESESGNALTAVGGIVGGNAGLIKDCTAKVKFYQNPKARPKIRGTVGIGSIAGYLRFGKIHDCTTKSGSVIVAKGVASGAQIGGIVGSMTGDSYFNEGTDVGECFRCIVERGVTLQHTECKGFVNYAGGISGYVAYAKDCYVGADIIADCPAGGIGAYIQTSKPIENCYWYGETLKGKEGSTYTIANTSNKIVNCYYGFINDDDSNSSVKITDTADNAKYKTTAQFNSGEVAYLLDGGVADIVAGGENPPHRNVWTQDKEKKMPVLGSPTYYRLTCDVAADGNADNSIIINGNEVTKANSKFVTYSPNGQPFDINVRLNPGFTKITPDGSKIITKFELKVTANGEDISNNYKTYTLEDKNCDLVAKFIKTVVTEKKEEPPVPGGGGGGGSSHGKGSGNGDGKGTGDGQGDGSGIGSGTSGDTNTKGDGNSATGIENGSKNSNADNRNASANSQNTSDTTSTYIPKVTEEKINQSLEEVVVAEPKEEIEETQEVIAPDLGSKNGGNDDDDEEEKITVFEIVSRTVKENPLVVLALVTIILCIIIAGGIGRTRKNKTKM